MRKNKKLLIGAIVVISLVILLAIFHGSFFAVTVGFTPIFCNDYEFTCCNEKPDATNTQFTLATSAYWECPSTATRCNVKLLTQGDASRDEYYYIGSGSCSVVDTTFTRPHVECSNERQITNFNVNTLQPNEKIYSSLRVALIGTYPLNKYEINSWKQGLDFCGRAGCSVGVPVSGADGCKFNPPGGKIYSSSSLSNPTLASSFTVPASSCVLAWQGNDRHICGYKEESCSSDSECGGHQFGNQECNGRTLQTYGCTSFGTVIQTTTQDGLLVKGDIVADNSAGGDTPDASKIDSNTFGKRCSITSAVTVQCCGDTDCGTNYFCDRQNGWVCNPTSQCTQNSDCGVSTQCDYFIKKLKTPKCSSGTCGWDEVSVDCCSDVNCASGYYCTAGRKCEPKIADCLACPFECCENECNANGGYLDRPCSPDKPYCNEHACSITPPPIKNCASCDAFALSTLIGSILTDKQCQASNVIGIKYQTITTCWLSFLRYLLIPIVLIFSLLFGSDFLQRFGILRKNKYALWLVNLIIAGLLSYIVYLSFWIGIIAFVIYIAIRVLVGGQIKAVTGAIRGLR